MNRLVIVGNGFDLAMGCPTRVEDFLLWLLKKYFKKITSRERMDFLFFQHKEFINKAIYHKEYKDSILASTDFRYVKESLSQNVFEITDPLLSEIFKLGNQSGWYDIEATYFDLIIKESKWKNTAVEKILSINKSLENLIKELQSYLVDLEKEFSINVNDELLLKLNRFKERNEFIQIHNSELKELVFVNFNYTSILDQALSKIRGLNNSSVFYIHGKLSTQGEHLPMLVGYGDDQSEEFQQLDEFRNSELLKYIKPFHYSRNSVVSQILDICESEPFTLYIVGHSCSDTDKTILKSIVNHANCAKVKVWHKGTQEDFFKRNIAVSRFFIDKEMRLSKILPYHESDCLPQLESKRLNLFP